MIKSFILYALLIGIVLPMSWAAPAYPAQITTPSPKGQGIPAELRAKAEKKLSSMGIAPEQYDAKLRECIDCKTDEDKKLSKTLILAGANMVIEPKGKEGVKAFGEKVRAAMKHPDVMKLWHISVAEKMKNIENMHDPERGDLLLQYNIVQWTPTRYEEKLNAAAAAAKAYGQYIKDAQNKPEGDAAHDAVKRNEKDYRKSNDELSLALNAESICTGKDVILKSAPLKLPGYGIVHNVHIPLTKEEEKEHELVSKTYKGITPDFFCVDKDVDLSDPEAVKEALIKLGVSFPNGAKASYNEKARTITASLLPSSHNVLQSACDRYADLLSEGESYRNRILQVFEKLERHSGKVDLKAKVYVFLMLFTADIENMCNPESDMEAYIKKQGLPQSCKELQKMKNVEVVIIFEKGSDIKLAQKTLLKWLKLKAPILLLDRQDPIAAHLSNCSGFYAHNRTCESIMGIGIGDDMSTFISNIKQKLDESAE